MIEFPLPRSGVGGLNKRRRRTPNPGPLVRRIPLLQLSDLRWAVPQLEHKTAHFLGHGGNRAFVSVPQNPLYSNLCGSRPAAKGQGGLF
jgi:hypothetical protein